MAANTAEYWSAKKGYAPSWYVFCAEEINRRISGRPNQGPSMWGLETFGGPLPTEHILEVGCLSGDKINNILKAKLTRKASGLDIAADAIALGQQKWNDGLTLAVGDLNAPELPKEAYSVIMANGVLHHISNLEICIEALYNALMPGGVLLASEFTGPCRYAYSEKETQHIRDGQNLLPQILRGYAFDPEQLARKLAADPSEAIRTRDIGMVLRTIFDDVIERPYGGNVLMRAMTPSFFKHFDPENPEHIEGIERLIAFDAEVSAQVPSHHIFFIARKGPLPVPPSRFKVWMRSRMRAWGADPRLAVADFGTG